MLERRDLGLKQRPRRRTAFFASIPNTDRKDCNIWRHVAPAGATLFVATLGALWMSGWDRTVTAPVKDAYHATPVPARQEPAKLRPTDLASDGNGSGEVEPKLKGSSADARGLVVVPVVRMA